MCFMERAISTTAANEVWRPVKGYEGLYEVSDHAIVRSLDRDVRCKIGYRCMKGKILVQRMWGNYLSVCLVLNQKEERKYVHRLVAEAFIQNPDNLPVVNHKDENKLNNIPENLEWCTAEYNMQYGTRIDRFITKRGTAVEQLTLDGRHVAYYRSAREAERMSNGKFANTHIIDAIHGNLQTAYGYLWRRIESPDKE